MIHMFCPYADLKRQLLRSVEKECCLAMEGMDGRCAGVELNVLPQRRRCVDDGQPSATDGAQSEGTVDFVKDDDEELWWQLVHDFMEERIKKLGPKMPRVATVQFDQFDVRPGRAKRSPNKSPNNHNDSAVAVVAQRQGLANQKSLKLCLAYETSG
jgi:hypothetical protein